MSNSLFSIPSNSILVYFTPQNSSPGIYTITNSANNYLGYFRGSSNGWDYIEATVCALSGSSGSLTIRCNGTQVFTISGNTFANSTWVGNNFSIGWNGYLNIDDWYLCDSTGTAANTFLGDSVIAALWPNTVVTPGTWSPTGNTTLWNTIGKPGDPNTSIYDVTTATSDTYYLSCNALPNNPSSISGIKLVTFGLKTGTSAATVNPLIKSNGTVANAASPLTLSTSLQIVEKVYQVDPNTGSPWTNNAVNLIQVGATSG